MDFDAEPRLAFVPAVDVPYEPALLVPRALTPRQCARVVALGRAMEPEDARVGAIEDTAAPDAATRRSRTAWIEHGPDSAWLYRKLADVARRANRTYGFDLIGFTEDLQFTAYDETDAYFDWHADGLAGEVAVRKLSIVVQLSEPTDYRGGDLEVFGVVAERDPDDLAAWSAAARQQGTAIVFPAFAQHRVRPLVAGARYSLVCWIGGPPFR